MVGVPARRIGWMSKLGEKLDDSLVCPVDGTRYKLIEENKLTIAE